MAIWSVWAAPLFMGNDLRSIRSEFREILQNEHLIGLNQDKLGVFGQMVAEKEAGQLQAFVKPVLPVRNGCPSFALVYLNRKPLGNHENVSSAGTPAARRPLAGRPHTALSAIRHKCFRPIGAPAGERVKTQPPPPPGVCV